MLLYEKKRISISDYIRGGGGREGSRESVLPNLQNFVNKLCLSCGLMIMKLCYHWDNKFVPVDVFAMKRDAIPD